MPADERANQIIAEYERENSRQANVRTLWQDTADFIYPYIDITTTRTVGEYRTDRLYDMTANLDMQDMVAGLKQILLPSGQLFFAIKMQREEDNNDKTTRYLSMLTARAHEELFASNFITEMDEVLRSLIVFGPGSIYSEWMVETGLNYRASIVGSYVLIEDAAKNVIGKLEKVTLSAFQARMEFGENAGTKVLECAADPKKKDENFEYIHKISFRKLRNKFLSDTLNMPYEAIYVNVKEKSIAYEDGYPENPCHTARWMRPGNEKDGRGIGTEILPQVKVLNRMMKDFLECGNKWNNQPLEVLDTFEGQVRVTPGAINRVQQMDSIRALDSVNGNFPITEKSLERQTAIIDRAFFRQAFAPLADLKGDRRTTLEIRERIRQTWHIIGPPIGRIWGELLDKCITRSILLLIRNGVVEKPPAEMQGQAFGIEYVGPLALELRSQQNRAFQEWISVVGQIATMQPDALDNVDFDDAIVRMGNTLGVNAEDIATSEERAAKREQRAMQQQQALAMQMGMTASKAYKDTSGAPEEGSGAQQVMEAVGA